MKAFLSCMAQCAFIAVVCIAGCATQTPNSSPVNKSVLGVPQSREAFAPASLPGDKSDLEKLAALWLKRSQEKASSDFPIGVGDVVEISVPAIEELRNRTVRISGDGTITLPFMGKVDAAGLTEEELRQTITERLKQYMYSPRVIVFVKEYRSRQVAVLGSVVRPGLYSVGSGADTLLDVLSQAGGIAPAADPKIYLIPAEPAEKNGRAIDVASLLPESVLQHDPAPLILKRTEPILIDLKQLSFGGNQQYMSVQIRPGDVIMVPGGGQVLVEGWVEKPGAYPVSPGLTVAGVVVQAGGPMFPADVNAVKVIRADKSGNKTFIVTDLQKIKRGETSDITLQGGDIVEVSSETSKLTLWGLYRFFTTVVNIGVGGNLPMFK
jgi:polysaccharide export outer membrane protein